MAYLYLNESDDFITLYIEKNKSLKGFENIIHTHSGYKIMLEKPVRNRSIFVSIKAESGRRTYHYIPTRNHSLRTINKRNIELFDEANDDYVTLIIRIKRPIIE